MQYVDQNHKQESCRTVLDLTPDPVQVDRGGLNASGADFIVEYLQQQGVPYVYEVIGGMITRLVDAIHQQGRIGLISVHHEQAAAFAADAMGRLTGIPGIAMGTSGPGATNLLTGIGSCYFDSVPAIFITGQVN